VRSHPAGLRKLSDIDLRLAQDSNRVAKAFGYTADQLQSIPDEAHMGLSCGNPVATASIKEVRFVPRTNVFICSHMLSFPLLNRESTSSILGQGAGWTFCLLPPRLDPTDAQSGSTFLL
jgi:hypothetical protein